MTTKTLWTVLAVCAAALSVGGLAQAQEKGGQGEGTAGPAYKASGTHDSRKSERSANRQKNTAAQKAGDGSVTGEGTVGPAYKASGTSTERKGERKENRAKNTEANKTGDIAPSGQK